MQELSNLHQRLGRLQKQVENEEANIQSLQYRLDEAARELEKANESHRDRQADLQRVQLVTNIQSVLEVYSDQLTHAKVESLQDAVVNCFNQLCRKRGLVKRIEIDPRNLCRHPL